MKKGFTLAEVLITLAVIGVVAALTIPVLIQKYQKKQLYSQFMKAYNTISTAIDNAVVENGEFEMWNWGQWKEDEETGEEHLEGGDNPIENYIFPQLKYVKKCDTYSDCFAQEYSTLNGGNGASEQYPDHTITAEIGEFAEEYSGTAVVLADGMVIMFGGDDGFMSIMVDTNGKKGPNVYGRDFFAFEYEAGDSRYNEPTGFEISKYREGENCDANSSSRNNGDGCVARLLQEGAMNY